MATAVISVDQLVASIRHSYVAANELMLRSAERGTAATHREAQFVIGNASGKPPVAIPLALFQSPVRYYLSTLHLDLPCYTLSGTRFFKGLQLTGATVLHSFTPTLWQRLFYICNLYRIVVEIGVSQTSVSFRAASAEEAGIRLAKNRKRPPIRWKFTLTPDQEQQLRSLPQITAKPIYWRSSFMRVWRWVRGNSNQA